MVELEAATVAPVFESWSEHFAEFGLADFGFEVCFDFFESLVTSSPSGSFLEL